MTALIALVSALIIGGSDFSGGLATRRDSTFRVTSVAQISGAATALILALLVGADEITRLDVVAGAIAGASGTFSFVCFYRALSMGSMSVIAPTTALVGATVPVFVGLVRGEDLAALTVAGILVAIFAILLVTRESRPVGQPRSTPTEALILAVVAGLGFSVFFIALAETNEASGLWPLVVARFVSVPVVAAISWRLVGRVRPVDGVALRLAVLTGVSEMAANALIIVALRRGPIAVVAVFGSLYPVSTVLLAWLLLRERISRAQLAGVGLALGALVLVAI